MWTPAMDDKDTNPEQIIANQPPAQFPHQATIDNKPTSRYTNSIDRFIIRFLLCRFLPSTAEGKGARP